MGCVCASGASGRRPWRIKVELSCIYIDREGGEHDRARYPHRDYQVIDNQSTFKNIIFP